MNNELLEKKTVFYVDQIRNLEAGGFEFPVTCEIDPSNSCVLDCSFCMFKNRDKSQVLSWDSYCWLLDELKNGGAKSITFTGGGEPICNPRINSMVDRAVALGFEVGMVTNGVLLDRLERPEAFAFIRVSLDAGDAEIYRAVKGKDLFFKVLSNAKAAISQGAHVGFSFVVTNENKNSMDQARVWAEKLGAMYIQFKPDTKGESVVCEVPDGGKVISMSRFEAKDSLPCKIAGLIGIVGADENLYFCCQYRGDGRFAFGRLKEKRLADMIADRNKIKPDVRKCPRCRYMNYAVSYRQLMEGGMLFYDHRNFL